MHLGFDVVSLFLDRQECGAAILPRVGPLLGCDCGRSRAPRGCQLLGRLWGPGQWLRAAGGLHANRRDGQEQVDTGQDTSTLFHQPHGGAGGRGGHCGRSGGLSAHC